jgi:hypothetical protein
VKVTTHKKYTTRKQGYMLNCRVYGRKKLNEYSQRTHILPAVAGGIKAEEKLLLCITCEYIPRIVGRDMFHRTEHGHNGWVNALEGIYPL